MEGIEPRGGESSFLLAPSLSSAGFWSRRPGSLVPFLVSVLEARWALEGGDPGSGRGSVWMSWGGEGERMEKKRQRGVR